MLGGGQINTDAKDQTPGPCWIKGWVSPHAVCKVVKRKMSTFDGSPALPDPVFAIHLTAVMAIQACGKSLCTMEYANTWTPVDMSL